MILLVNSYWYGTNPGGAVYIVDTTKISDADIRNLFETESDISGPEAFAAYEEMQEHPSAFGTFTKYPLTVEKYVMIWCE